MYIQLNGQILYYEKTGEGQPFILVHGNGGSHEVFDVLTSQLSEHYTVYGIDSRGHGLSATPTELHYIDMAEDIAAFIDALELERPLFYGFSDGAIVGLLLASMYPSKLDKLMISGANLNPKDLKGSFYRHLKKEYKKNPRELHRLMLEEPNITEEDLHDITIPTLVLAGEKDLIKKKVTQKIAQHIEHATLVIVPGEDHGSYVEHSEKLYPLLMDFLGKYE
ncbi:MAG: alpha/beta fold hydrolase [Roseburia sp.]